MKLEPVIINDEKMGVFFSFIRQFPEVSAQADTVEEVISKLQSNWETHKRFLNTKELDSSDVEIETFG